MSINSKGRRNSEVDTELNMIPIMNIFLVIIPFLLSSVSFFHIKAISTSVPVMADNSTVAQKNNVIKVTVILEMRPKVMRLSAEADGIALHELKKYEKSIQLYSAGMEPFEDLNEYLQELKTAYPASDTLLLIADEKVRYESIIQTMDAARKYKEIPLFPNVVLTGSLG